MLEEVRITGLGVIDDAVLELSSGFTVLTGETGAGKTMVVTALGLLFGGRADPARVRPGADKATVEGRLFVSAEVAREVEDAGGDLDDNGSSLVLRRSVSAGGRARGFGPAAAAQARAAAGRAGQVRRARSCRRAVGLPAGVRQAPRGA